MYASRRRAPLMIRRSPRRAAITDRAKLHLSQRSNPSSWPRLPPWRLTDGVIRYARLWRAERETRAYPPKPEERRGRAGFFLFAGYQNGERFFLSPLERVGEGGKLSHPIQHP